VELHEEIWSAALARLKTSLDGDVYSRWIAVISPVSLRDGVLVVAVDNEMLKMWVENNYLPYILDAARIDSAERVSAIEITVDSSRTPAAQEAPEPEPAAARGRPGAGYSRTPRSGNGINPNYTFADFIIGPSNSFAHAASAAVASNPGNAYNPLFIYGDTGLGKTHLMQAVAHGVLSQNPDAVVCYITSEALLNDFIDSIRNNMMADFRRRYRNADVLLIDDIHFLADKDTMQEEFFHTFNTLHGQDKQIVISSDRPPKAMVTLEERLRSRFEWGLTADIQAPDVETRIAILRSKAERARRDVPVEILEMIARQIQSNIRELEGALTRVLAFSDLRGKPLTLELATIALADMIPQRNNLDPRRVVDVVATVFGISPEKLMSKSRTHEVALPRQVAMYLMRQEAKVSLPQIGEALGGRDHKTLNYA
jgi:chromosomal replication initiator protein